MLLGCLGGTGGGGGCSSVRPSIIDTLHVVLLVATNLQNYLAPLFCYKVFHFVDFDYHTNWRVFNALSTASDHPRPPSYQLKCKQYVKQ